MNWSDISAAPSPRKLRQFSVAWLLFFLGWSALAWLRHHRPQVALALAAAAVLVGFAGLLRPVSVRWLFSGAMALVFPIGWLVSQLTLALLYFGVFTPLAAWFRWRGRDPLQRQMRPGQASYWLPKAAPMDVRRYFRQY